MGHKNKIQDLFDFRGKYYKVISKEPKEDNFKRKQNWDCLCECGKIFTEAATRIRSGRRKSCGCKSADRHFKYKNENPKTTSWNKLYDTYKRHAIQRNLEWSLDSIQCNELFTNKCYYCKSEPYCKLNSYGYYKNKEKDRYKDGEITYNGIDRTDNNKGYTIINCVTCCKKCNIAKHEMTTEEFKQWIIKIYENFVFERPSWIPY